RDSLALRAAAEALAYLQETQRSAAQHVVRVQVEQPSQFLWIDPGAVQNLEIFRGPEGRRTGTLLAVVDRTLTAAGGRMLARWLAAPLLDLSEIHARHDSVEELSQAAVLREELGELSELAHGGRAAIAAMESAERTRTGIASLKVRYNRIFGFYIEVTKPNLHLVPADYQRKSSTVGAERFVTPALAEHESRVLS